MTIWTVPTHLPDLRRVDDNIVAIDTEDERRGPARRPRLGLAVARRLDLRHHPSPGAKAARSARSISRCVIPTASISIPPQVSRWLKDHIAAGVRFVTLNGPL